MVGDRQRSQVRRAVAAVLHAHVLSCPRCESPVGVDLPRIPGLAIAASTLCEPCSPHTQTEIADSHT